MEQSNSKPRTDPLPPVLLPEDVARILSISRAKAMEMMRVGTIPSRKVGSHRRVTLTDLLAYRADMVARRRAVLDQMSRDADELGLYD